MKKTLIKIIVNAAIISIVFINNSFAAYANTVSFKNLNDIKQNIYEHLRNRDQKIEFLYTGDMTEFKNNINQIIIDAYKTDDYTARSWVEIKPKVSIYDDKVNTTMNVTYLTTKEQENYIDTELKNSTLQLIRPGMNGVEKVKAINDYIIGKYEYDYTYKSNNPYTALKTGKTICQGYSMTAYKMLSYAGIENRIIIGSKDGVSHSWNYVKVNGEWYYLDITNNDSTRSNKYFLVKDDILKQNNYIW